MQFPMRYFDYNATTPLCAAAKRAWNDAVDRAWQNPSSPYRSAAAVNATLEDRRERLGQLLSVDSSRIVFNSGATEGNNAVFCHQMEIMDSAEQIALSPIEHPSVLEPAKKLFQDRIVWLPVDSNGMVQIEGIDLGKVGFLSLMAANNETGVLQPWARAAEICAERGIPFHCDASQWIGKMPTKGLSNCSFVTGCGHKFGGPKGCGFLVLPESGCFGASLHGGSQQNDRRAGTEDFASVSALVSALEWSNASQTHAQGEAKEAFLAEISEVVPGTRAVHGDASTLWNTVMLEMPKFASSRWIAFLEKRGFLISSGSACSTGKAGPSHVLASMGCDAGAMRRSIRISSGWETCQSDWQALKFALVDVYDALNRDKASSDSQVISF